MPNPQKSLCCVSEVVSSERPTKHLDVVCAVPCLRRKVLRLVNSDDLYGGNANIILQLVPCFYHLIRLLVSTYVVCERLSVMHEPAGVVENLVQILQNTPIL